MADKSSSCIEAFNKEKWMASLSGWSVQMFENNCNLLKFKGIEIYDWTLKIFEKSREGVRRPFIFELIEGFPGSPPLN